ncbi:MAG: hypothetical protein ACI90V_003035 [Bacillariaceae sp.]|jgi:hypothetical protein
MNENDRRFLPISYLVSLYFLILVVLIALFIYLFIYLNVDRFQEVHHMQV